MTATVPEEPRQGTYLPTYTLVDTEGGGDLHANSRVCDGKHACWALVAEGHFDEHVGQHEVAASGGGGEPKSART
jgi:hypothetical protein